ncbi:hypothetical protein H9P43_006700 [Blastocladiella emersonii ATCC 22665]|nr:hypothetical protein H9P43_006700 [Blastocladiella emersonii ATCC 22665]
MGTPSADSAPPIGGGGGLRPSVSISASVSAGNLAAAAEVGRPGSAATTAYSGRAGSAAGSRLLGRGPTGGKSMGGRLERCRHCKDVYAVMLDLKAGGHFADLDLRMPDGSVVRAHRMVLATASAVLRAALLEDPAATELDLAAFLAHDPHAVANAVVDYMYSRQAYVHPRNVLGMTRAARDLGIADLLQLSTSILGRFVVADPAAILPSAVQFNAHDLVAQIVEVLLNPATARGIMDATASWDALPHLPVPAFLHLLGHPQCRLDAAQRFELVRLYVDRNVDPAHRVCLIHPHGPAPDSSTEHDDDESQESLCTCAIVRPLTPDELHAVWSAIDFAALDTDVLSRAFTLPNVPHDLVFNAVLAKLMQIQQQQAHPHFHAAAAAGSVNGSSPASRGATPPSGSIPVPENGGMSHAEQAAVLAATLSRIKAQQNGGSGAGSPAPPVPMQHAVPPGGPTAAAAAAASPVPAPAPLAAVPASSVASVSTAAAGDVGERLAMPMVQSPQVVAAAMSPPHPQQQLQQPMTQAQRLVQQHAQQQQAFAQQQQQQQAQASGAPQAIVTQPPAQPPSTTNLGPLPPPASSSPAPNPAAHLPPHVRPFIHPALVSAPLPNGVSSLGSDLPPATPPSPSLAAGVQPPHPQQQQAQQAQRASNQYMSPALAHAPHRHPHPSSAAGSSPATSPYLGQQPRIAGTPPGSTVSVASAQSSAGQMPFALPPRSASASASAAAVSAQEQQQRRDAIAARYSVSESLGPVVPAPPPVAAAVEAPRMHTKSPIASKMKARVSKLFGGNI